MFLDCGRNPNLSLLIYLFGYIIVFWIITSCPVGHSALKHKRFRHAGWFGLIEIISYPPADDDSVRLLFSVRTSCAFIPLKVNVVSLQAQDPQVLEQLSKNITRMGLTNFTLNYLRVSTRARVRARRGASGTVILLLFSSNFHASRWTIFPPNVLRRVDFAHSADRTFKGVFFRFFSSLCFFLLNGSAATFCCYLCAEHLLILGCLKFECIISQHENKTQKKKGCVLSLLSGNRNAFSAGPQRCHLQKWKA